MTPTIGTPKSERGYRTLPLDAEAVAALTALQAAQMAEMDAAGAAYVSAGYICADEMGAPPHPERYSDEFARLCREESSRDELASSDAVGSPVGSPVADSLRGTYLDGSSAW